MASMYEQCLAGTVEECEEMVAGVAAACSWMTEEDVAWLRQMAAWHFEVTVGEGQVNLEDVVVPLAALAQRAKEVGDEERYEIFDAFYREVC